MLGLPIRWICLVLSRYTLATYINMSEITTTSKTKAVLVKPIHHRKPTDPMVLSMLEEIFGKEDKEVSDINKCSVTTPVNPVTVSRSELPKTSSPMKGGTLPMVEYKGIGNGTQDLIGQHNEMGSCLRLVRQAQAKLKYFWNKIYHSIPSAGSDVAVVGMEKTSPGSSNNLEVPLTLQMGEPSVKS